MNEVLYSAILRKARRDRGREDILYFAQYYLPHIFTNTTPLFHKEILSLLRTEKRLGIAAPRGFAKSTIVQLVYGLHCLLYNDMEDILTISQSSNLAEDWLRKLKFELEGNEKIKNDFGGILRWGEKDSKRWTEQHLIIQKDNRVFSQIRARGRGCQVRGLRPTRVFCDDLEDEEMVRSEEQRKYLEEWFLGSLLNVLRNDQQLVVIGTVLHPIALLTKIIEKRDQFSQWNTRRYKALIDGNKSLWDDRFPVAELLRRKAEIGTYAFEAEFQNNPVSSDICLWRPEWIKRYEKLPEIKLCFSALDPATSTKESADYSAMTAWGIGTDNNIYELESQKGRWGTWELVDRVIAFYQKHNPIRFGIEEIAFQGVMKDLLIRECIKRGIKRIPIEGITLGSYTGKEPNVKQPKDKYTRALSIIHLFEQGSVYLRSQSLIDQLSMFPTGSEDDLVDSAVYGLMMIQKYAPIKIMVNNPNNQYYHQGQKSFEIKDNTMPPMVDLSKPVRLKSWRIGG
jgi:predicted phage terminase large subunit-like protein